MPAMAARLTDRVWALRKILLFCAPPWPQSHALERDGREGAWCNCVEEVCLQAAVESRPRPCKPEVRVDDWLIHATPMA
jgi:hypothetical protein